MRNQRTAGGSVNFRDCAGIALWCADLVRPKMPRVAKD
jgi:hypothetical protein